MKTLSSAWWQNRNSLSETPFVFERHKRSFKQRSRINCLAHSRYKIVCASDSKCLQHVWLRAILPALKGVLSVEPIYLHFRIYICPTWSNRSKRGGVDQVDVKKDESRCWKPNKYAAGQGSLIIRWPYSNNAEALDPGGSKVSKGNGRNKCCGHLFCMHVVLAMALHSSCPPPIASYRVAHNLVYFFCLFCWEIGCFGVQLFRYCYNNLSMVYNT